ncbi:Protein Ves [Asticcacaulis sp. MM231]|uniref:HutD/Ves family protein n=1 Tax=Asticcacaulis sp. MM231 TaxID=3157666 RepID=UPI0032D579F0
MIRYLPSAARVATPWKNGGGVTREVAVFPVGASMDDFLWRVSMAVVTEAGPFSLFTNIDRHLTVLSGSLRLEFSDRSVILATCESLAFAGDVPVHGTPLAPVTDLNVMTRRGQMRADVRRIDGEMTLQSGLLIVTEEQTVEGHALKAFDALMIADETLTATGLLIAFHEIVRH